MIRIQRQHLEGEEGVLRLKEAVVEGRCHRRPLSLLPAVAEPIVGSIGSKQRNSGILRMLRTDPRRCRSTAHIGQHSPRWPRQGHFRRGQQLGSLMLKPGTVGCVDYIRHSHHHYHHHVHVLHHILLRRSDDLLRAGRSRRSHAEEGFL